MRDRADPTPAAHHAFAAATLALLCFAVFLPTLPFALTNWDDIRYVTQNPYIRVLNAENLHAIATRGYFANYHPLTMFTYALDYAVAGLDPRVYRAQNIAWHTAAALVAGFLLARGFGLGLWGWVIAAWFAVHPQRYESVVWISERKDVLCVFFFVAALAVRHFARGMNAQDYYRRRFPIEASLLLLALLSKSMAMTYFLVALVHDLLLREGPVRERGRWASVGILAALCVAFAFIAFETQRGATMAGAQLPLLDRLAIMSYAPAYHLSRAVVPLGLSPMHPLGEAPAAFSARQLLAAATSIAVFVLAIRLWTRRPAAAFGLAFFFITLFPVSGIVPLGEAFVADRYSYLPMVGILIAMGEGVLALGARWRIGLFAMLGLLVLVSNPPAQLAVWRDSASLWKRVLEVYPTHEAARVSIAHQAFLDADPSARAQVEEPGLAQDRAGHAAGLAFRIRIAAGDFAGALAAAGALPDERSQLAARIEIAAASNDRAAAADAAARLFALGESDPDRLAVIANALLRAGRIEDAGRALDAAREPSLLHAAAMGMMANVVLGRGDVAGAESWLARAERTDPAQFDVVRARLVLHSQRQEAALGLRAAQRLLRRPDLDARARDLTLAMAGFFAEVLGDLPTATGFYRRALDEGTSNTMTVENYLRLASVLGDTDGANQAKRRLDELLRVAAGS